MTFFQEVYDRIRCATNARTQTELAAVLEIRQSSISDAKRRNSIPSDWYMKLFEKFGLNPDWIKSGTGPMFLKIDQVYTPVEGPPEGFHEEPAHYADPNAISTLTKVYSTQCAYEEGHPAPDLQTSGKIALPQSYVNAQTLVFHIESDSFSPLVRRGAYVGSEIGDISYFKSDASLAKYAGFHWKKNDSGNFIADEKHSANSCNKYLKYYITQSTQMSVMHGFDYTTSFYRKKYNEASTHKHRRALVLTSRKLVRLIYVLLRDSKLYVSVSHDTVIE